MQPVVVRQAFVRTLLRAQPAIVVLVHQVFDNRTGFGDGPVAVGYDRRLAQRMHVQEFGRRKSGLLVAAVALDLVVASEFFEEPENALRTGVLEVVDGDHGGTSLRCPGRL